MSEPVRKIFIGLNNISSQIGDFARAFERLGVETLTAAYRQKRIVDSSTLDCVVDDRVLEIERQHGKSTPALRQRIYTEVVEELWRRAVDECDTFFFIWSSFTPDFSDYRLLKEKGKRIVTFFAGDDARWLPAMEQEFAMYGMPPIEYDPGYYEPGDLPVHKLHFVRTAERYSDVIYCHPGHGQLLLRPYMSSLPPLDIGPFHENARQRRRPLVVHAPSSSALKGTRHVLPVIERLQEEGVAFDFELIQNLPYRQAIARYSDADILIGQMFAPAGGRQEREALASGTVVLSSVRYHYPQKYLDGCPIIDVSPESLYDELKAIIEDLPRRQDLALKGRPYVEKHHNIVDYCAGILRHLQSDSLKFDYHPEFFRHHFLPENPATTAVYNTYTRYVESTGWYREHVSTGERAGLVF